MSSDDTSNDVSVPTGPATIHSEDDAARGRAFTAVTAAANGQDVPYLDDDTASDVGRMLSTNAPSGRVDGMSSFRRKDPADLAGSSHDGERDYYETFGYPDYGSISFTRHKQFVDRLGIAQMLAYRVVAETWKNDPQIIDDGRAEGADPTQFEQDLQTLFDGLPEDRGKGLPFHMKWGDEKQRPGRYGLLFLGFDDGRPMNQPVDVSQLNGPDDLRYGTTFDEGEVLNWKVSGEYDEDDVPADADRDVPPERLYYDPGEGDPVEYVTRPDAPVLYELEFSYETGDGKTETTSKWVHHSRLIHLVEDPEESIWLGRRCLRVHINRLIDYIKVIGSAAEGQYSSADRKYAINSTAEDGADAETIQKFDQQMYEMVNDMRTALYTENADIQDMGGFDVDPSGPMDELYAAFAGPSQMPQRIMKGSERGDLASSQDQATWFSNVRQRQGDFAEDAVIRPLIDRLITFGIVDEPDDVDNEYTVKFPNLFELTELEESELESNRASAVKAAHDAIAAGADRDAVYEFVGIPNPDGDAGDTSSSPEAVNHLDESDPSVSGATDLFDDGDN